MIAKQYSTQLLYSMLCMLYCAVLYCCYKILILLVQVRGTDKTGQVLPPGTKQNNNFFDAALVQYIIRTVL